MRKISLVLAVLAAIGLPGLAVAAAAPSNRVTVETMRLSVQGSTVQVDEHFTFARPLQVPTAVGFVSRPTLVTRLPHGAVWQTDGLLLPAGTRSASFTYRVAASTGSVSAARSLPLPEQTLWVLQGPGVTLPIMLNQAFFDEGTVTINGVAYQRERATGVKAGGMRFNLQVQQAPPLLLMGGAWILIGALAMVLVAMALERRRRPTGAKGGNMRWRR